MSAPGLHGLRPVGILALCPLLGAGETLLTSAVLAVLFLSVLTLASGTMALLGRAIATDLRVLAIFIVAGFWVTLCELLVQANWFALAATLEIYLPLLAANCLVLAAAEISLRGVGPVAALTTGSVLGAEAAAWLVPMGTLREVLGQGAILSDAGLLPGMPGPIELMPLSAPIFQQPAGAFLLLAAGAALHAHLRRHRATL